MGIVSLTQLETIVGLGCTNLSIAEEDKKEFAVANGDELLFWGEESLGKSGFAEFVVVVDTVPVLGRASLWLRI